MKAGTQITEPAKFSLKFFSTSTSNIVDKLHAQAAAGIHKQKGN